MGDSQAFVIAGEYYVKTFYVFVRCVLLTIMIALSVIN